MYDVLPLNKTKEKRSGECQHLGGSHSLNGKRKKKGGGVNFNSRPK